MFGFLTLGKEADKTVQAVYNQHFCGLCSALSEDYGMFARMFTNYDATLIYLLSVSQVEKEITSKRVRCPIHFSRRDVILIPELAKFSSAISIELVYEKMLDDEYDEKKRYPTILKKYITKRHAKAKEALTELRFDTNLIGKLMRQQRELEKTNELTIRSLCEPTALMMKYIFGHTDQLTNPTNTVCLEKTGYAIGQLIYLMDSITDYTEDIKFGKFNALFACYPDYTKANGSNKMPCYLPDEIEEIISNCFKEIENGLKDATFYHFKGLIDNILVSSLSDRFTHILSDPVEQKDSAYSSSIISEFPIYASCIPFIPEKAFASNGANPSGGCLGSLIMLAIIIFSLRFMLKGCTSGNVCGDSKPDKIQVNQACGGNKTYYKHSDGKYRENPSSSCC
ncbi:MAG: DUF5685 family protein [Deltaproteobacteria bacterium]|nr:DUF5685 family protein [Deltaproteobacteria bacterium]